MKCPVCGYEFEGVGLYCPRCGAALTPEAESLLLPQKEEAPTMSQEEKIKITGTLLENTRKYARKRRLEKEKKKLMLEIDRLKARAQLEGPENVKEDYERLKNAIVNVVRELSTVHNIPDPPWVATLEKAMNTVNLLKKLESRMGKSKVITDGYMRVRDDYRSRLNAAAVELTDYLDTIEETIKLFRDEINDALEEIDSLRVRKEVGEIDEDAYEKRRNELKKILEEDEMAVEFLREQKEKITMVLKTVKSFLPR